MNFLSIFGGNTDGRFISEKMYNKILERQLRMTPGTLSQLRKLGVTDETRNKLEFFFYTNTKEKADNLAEELKNMGYLLKNVDKIKKNNFVVTGWTSEIQMSDASVMGWNRSMIDIGYKFDAELDGWGTYTPNPQATK